MYWRYEQFQLWWQKKEKTGHFFKTPPVLNSILLDAILLKFKLMLLYYHLVIVPGSEEGVILVTKLAMIWICYAIRLKTLMLWP